MSVIYIPEADAAQGFVELMARVRAGAEVIIENGSLPPALLQAQSATRRTIDQCLALARKHEMETGEAPVLDADFAEDVEEVIRSRKS